ncbi:MAG TPA: glutamine--fructose-6-phosphate transaminase (isomerizing) [Kofleriaceae bacterium]|nr:glutamine--fructose-6-phosphate transaminase (isomerizing) [Kofleriaceae bacterium]
MCGIVGYVGDKQATPILISGLRRLEYRGYDSAGVAVWDGAKTRVVRCRGKLSGLEDLLVREPAAGSVGMGHTRWATHGKPSDENAHPHRAGAVSVIHNGIIENHLQLRQQLIESGSKFTSETDTEIFAHLINAELKRGAASLPVAVRSTIEKVRGAFAIVVMSDEQPGVLVGAKSASPLIVGVGQGENFLASDVPAILEHTRDVMFIDEREIVTITKDKVELTDFEGKPIERQPRRITWSAVQAEKAGFRHFMLKEIHEQPRVVSDTMAGRIDLENDDVTLDGIELEARGIRRVVMIACGTSHHAAMVGKFLVEGLARIPCEVDLASEYRYRDPIVGPGDLVVAISQSGETADTMAAVREAAGRGARTMAICNVVDSSIPRTCDYAFYTHAGPEIGVASTKAFTTQLVAMVELAVHLGRRSGALSRERARARLSELVQIPAKMTEVIDHAAQIHVLARRYGNAGGFLFLGRGMQYPIALEGALKLKEISYIHAEGYAAGEMKHGPIALIDSTMPVVVLAPRGPTYEKVISNMTEARARDGKILAIATRGDGEIGGQADDVILVPDTVPELQPLLTVLPLQLLAYHVADLKGTDIDQPRNLAKSVTVE